MSVFDEILSLKARFETQVKEQGKELLHKHFTEYFEANPEVEAVKWAQYTPYFNDGEPCEFTVHDPETKLVGDGDYDYDYGGPGQKLIDEVPTEVMLAVFGDHTEIVATRQGFEVTEYDHD
jgi:hypothetical protein